MRTSSGSGGNHHRRDPRLTGCGDDPGFKPVAEAGDAAGCLLAIRDRQFHCPGESRHQRNSLSPATQTVFLRAGLHRRDAHAAADQKAADAAGTTKLVRRKRERRSRKRLKIDRHKTRRLRGVYMDEQA